MFPLISNDSKPPSRVHYFTEKRSSTIKFSSNNKLVNNYIQAKQST